MQVGQLDLSNMNELESIDGNLQSEKIDSKMIEEEYKLQKRGRRQLILYSSFLFTADELSTTTTNDFRNWCTSSQINRPVLERRLDGSVSSRRA